MSEELIGGCRMIRLKVRGDERGSLVAIEGAVDVPFDIGRVYYVFGSTAGVDRGQHAHRACRQFAVAVAGSCRMKLDDGKITQAVALNRPDMGITIEPMVWHEMSDFSNDCVLMVLADQAYDESDYIRNHAEFTALAAA